jgi:hypothetical protein
MSDNKTFQVRQHVSVVGCGESLIQKISGKVAYIVPENDKMNPRWVPTDSLRESNRYYGTYRCDADGNHLEPTNIYGDKIN